MTDDEREAELRHGRVSDLPRGGDVAFVLRRLDEARADLTKALTALRDRNDELARLRAPSDADAMERARRVFCLVVGEDRFISKSDWIDHIVRALTEYGDQRAREAIEELRKTCADILGQDASWPAHGNAPLAIAAALQLRVTAAREARAAALEETIQFIENGRFLHDDAPPKRFAIELIAGLRRHFGGLVDTPPQSEGGEG